LRGTAATGWTILLLALASAVAIVVALYAWDTNARTAEAALRPAPVAPLAPVTQTSSLPLGSAASNASPVPPAVALPGGDATAGKDAFARACNACHPNAGAGIGPALYGPQFAQRYPDDSSIAAVIRRGKGGMPAIASSSLTDQDLANVIAYMRGLGSGAIAPEPTPTPRPRQRSG
jgi:mono/diheme cytochrome c family protein